MSPSMRTTTAMLVTQMRVITRYTGHRRRNERFLLLQRRDARDRLFGMPDREGRGTASRYTQSPPGRNQLCFARGTNHHNPGNRPR
jgi:hypothetical protein